MSLFSLIFTDKKSSFDEYRENYKWNSKNKKKNKKWASNLKSRLD
jgi:hypothetical protein